MHYNFIWDLDQYLKCLLQHSFVYRYYFNILQPVKKLNRNKLFICKKFCSSWCKCFFRRYSNYLIQCATQLSFCIRNWPEYYR